MTQREAPRDRSRIALAALILTAQIVGIGIGRVTNESFWSWMPHDRALDYELDVSVGGRALEAAEVRERYGLAQAGRRADNVEDVIAIVQTHEQRRPDDQTAVILRYSINDGEEQVWRWPVE